MTPAGLAVPPPPRRGVNPGVPLAAMVAASNVMELQLPGLPLSLDDIGMVLVAIAMLAAGLRIRLSPLLMVFAAIVFMVQANHAIFTGDADQVIMAAVKTGVQLLVFSALYEMMMRDDRVFVALGRWWVALATLSGLIIILQFVGLLPNLVLIDGALELKSRPAGLQNDPNFAAYSLVIAILFLRTLGRRFNVMVCATILVLALILTESRMGLVLLVICGAYFAFPTGRRLFRGNALLAFGGLLAAPALLAGGILLSTLSPNFGDDEGKPFLLGRFAQAGQTLSTLTLAQLAQARGQQEDSERERLLLFYAGIMVWQNNFWTGAGQDVTDKIQDLVKVRKATHSAYADSLAIGGVAGLVFIASVLYALQRSFRLGRSAAPEILRRSVGAWMLVAVLGSFFLNVSYWPVICLLAVCLARMREARAPRVQPAAEARA